MLRIHYLQQWFGLSDPAMEESLHDVPPYQLPREFAGLGDGVSRLPHETTILRSRHLLEARDLAVDSCAWSTTSCKPKACCCAPARRWTPR